MSELLRDLLILPDRVRRGDFVLSLSEGVSKPAETVSNYVVTEQLVTCFDEGLGLIKSAVEGNTSKGCYLHGSFGSGKSHFMAVLHLLLQGNREARSIPELSSVISKHNEWTEGKNFLLLPYHMIGKESMESAILGGYAEKIHTLHPEASIPGVYRSEGILDDADSMRKRLGDDSFFAALNEGANEAGKDGWGDFATGWTVERFEHARNAPAHSDDRVKLVGDLVSRFFTSARATSEFVELGDGLSIISKHAKGLGYDGVILFLDELILWLASRAADVQFVNREGPKLANLVEAQTADRPIPLVSFVARQRDLKELVGDQVSGADYLRFSDSLDWWEARFATIKLADRNLPAIAERRVLKPRSEEAKGKIDAAFEETSRMRQQVLDVLLTRNSDKTMFRKIYPFSPAFMDTLVEMSFLLQRERTALKVMLQILIGQGDRLQLGDVVPVGDLFDAIAEGDEAVSEEIKRRFDYAKKLYEEKFRPQLVREYGIRFEKIESLPEGDEKVAALRNDDRLVKTLLLAALAPNVEALRGLNANRLAALNHGTIRSPIPGREGQIVLNKCRKWAGEIGQLKIGEDPTNPSISVQLSEVDTDGIIDGAQVFDNPGNRIRKIRELLFREFGIEDRDDLMLSHKFMWQGTSRLCDVLFQNIRKIPQHTLLNKKEEWTVIIDWPFDDEGRGLADDRALLTQFQEEHPEGSRTIIIQPSFLGHDALKDLGKLVILDHLMKGDNFVNHTRLLTPANRETARELLNNQRSQLQQRVITYLENAYGIADTSPQSLDTSNLMEGADHFTSLDPALELRPPASANLGQAFIDLLGQALQVQYPAHPKFDDEAKLTLGVLKKVLEQIYKATETEDGRVGVERVLRKELRQVANPLKLGSMEETHFILGDYWKNHFIRRQADTHGDLTVENLRKWMDEPNATGLPDYLRNLVVLAYAAQTNHSFFLHGTAVEPGLEDVKPEMELRTVDLPNESEWNEARERVGHLFGVVAPQLVSASSVGGFSDKIKSIVLEHKGPVQELVATLEKVWSSHPELESQAPRLRTARAALAGLGLVSNCSDRKLVKQLAEWGNPVSDGAVGTSIKKAGDVVRALTTMNWGLMTTLEGVPDSHATEVARIQSQLKEALQTDEHALALAPQLKKLDTQALELIQNALKTQAPKPPEPLPPPAPEPDNVEINPKPVSSKSIVGQKEVTGSDLRKVTEEIQNQAKGFKNPKIRINWEIYE